MHLRTHGGLQQRPHLSHPGIRTIEYAGRIDDQVKIRGHRIELEEIEKQLQEYPGVKDAVVVADRHESGDASINAYLVNRTPLSACNNDRIFHTRVFLQLLFDFFKLNPVSAYFDLVVNTPGVFNCSIRQPAC